MATRRQPMEMSLQVRSSIEEYQGGAGIAQKRTIVFLTIEPKNFPTGSFQQHENVEPDTS